MTAFPFLRSLPLVKKSFIFGVAPLLLAASPRRRRTSRARNSRATASSVRPARARTLRVRAWPVFALLLAAGGLVWWKRHHAPRTLAKWATAGAFASVPAANRYDVLVVGGTPSGVAAALAAGRRGARVLLIEQRPHLGGDAVYAMLNQLDVPIKPGQATPVHGIFAEFFDQLGVAFSIEHAQKLFESTVRVDPNIEVMTLTHVTRILKSGNRVVGAEMQKVSSTGKALTDSNSNLSTSAVSAAIPGGGPLREVLANTVVDATNDADFAARAGSGYDLGREYANPDKKMQSASLLFSVSGVDWKQVRKYVSGRRRMRASDLGKMPISTREKAPDARVSPDFEYSKPGHSAARSTLGSAKTHFSGRSWNDKSVDGKINPKAWIGLGGVHGGYAWERGDIIKAYRARGADIMVLSINFGRQEDGSVILNTLNILNVNGLNAQSRRHARNEALAELPFLITYLRRKMPGFQNAKLKQAAPELYIRETRHIHGLYTLQADDVFQERIFSDSIAMATYPLDLHPYTRGQINPFGARRYYYTLPLRSLIPKDVDGVFVASRSLSATYSAAGSCRVMPITMAAGEASGVAAWLCARKNLTPHDLVPRDLSDGNLIYLRDIQASLRDGGADIGGDIASLIRGAALSKRTSSKSHKP